MIDKSERLYIKKWFDDGQKFEVGDRVVFDMPAFCSGDYSAKIHLDADGDAYIKKSESYYRGCRGVYIQSKSKK